MAPSQKKKTKAEGSQPSAPQRIQASFGVASEPPKRREEAPEAAITLVDPKVVDSSLADVVEVDTAVRREDTPEAPVVVVDPKVDTAVRREDTPEAPIVVVDPKIADCPVVDVVAIDTAEEQQVGATGTDALPSDTMTAGEPEAEAAATVVTVKNVAKQYVQWSNVQVRDSYVYATGTIGDLVISIKTKLAVLAETSAAKTLEPYAVKAQGLTVQIIGRVGGTTLCIKAWGLQALQKVATTYSTLRDTIIQNANHFASKVLQQWQASLKMVTLYLAPIVEPTITYVRGGYTFALGRVGDMALSVQGKGENIKNSILQTYARTRLLIIDASRPVLARVSEITSPVISKICDGLGRCRIAIKDGFLTIKGRVADMVVHIRLRLSDACRTIVQTLGTSYAALRDGSKLVVNTVGDRAIYIVARATDAVADAYSIAERQSKTVKAKVAQTLKDDCFKASSGSAFVGAAACGASGGATGFVTGGAVGAALGLVPAVFTFGLSIPIGAAIGSGTGLCVGAVTGGTVGFVGGGAAGYGARKHKAEIGTKLTECKEFMKNKKTAIYIGATGGTA
jgi:hypothetical protein